MYKARVTPNWFDGNTKFWYRNDLPNSGTEFVLVDAVAGTRVPAFDHAKLAAALGKASNTQMQSGALPFDGIQFTDDNKAVRFTISNVTWKCRLDTYEVTRENGPAVMADPEILRDLHNPNPLLASDGADGMQLLASPQATEAATQTQPATQSQPATQTQPVAGGRGGRGGGGGGGGGFGRGGRGGGQTASADRKWTVLIQNNNIVLHPADGTADVPLSTDGTAAFPYVRPTFSPDSSAVLAYRMEDGDHFNVTLVQSTPAGPAGSLGGGVGRVAVTSRPYPLPGEKLDSYELNTFNIATKKQSKPLGTERWDMSADGGDANPAGRWVDGFHYRIEKYDRGHQRFRFLEVDAQTGAARNIIDDKSSTFIWSAHRDGLNLPAPGGGNNARTFQLVNSLAQTDEIIYCSEMDGWRHLFLIDAKAGKIKNTITQGDFPVRFIDFIDEANRVVWFMANGVYPGQDPLFMHYGHVNFDGTGLVWMTDGNGMHNVNYSPDYKYLIDTYSRVDMPPVNELRRASDGKLVVALEKAVVEGSANPLEAFAAKGRDGKTDIWGTIARPRNFDATKKYPIIENIYAGPQGSQTGSFVPKTYATNPSGGDNALLNLGFVVVHIDGMGTPGRSKAFHDVCWHNLADAGLPDRIAWIKAAAAKYPALDADRVGIFGTSAGGQNTGSALLFHGDFYKVGVANSGCHDNRMDKVSWNEQWMGYPVGPQYSASSNIDNAYRLQGHLQLVVGELDTNVPPESTYRFVDALIRAHRDFEFVMVPSADHGAAAGPQLPAGETIVSTKLQDFFVRYLQGTEPANRNSQPGIPPTPSTGGPGRGRGG